MRRALAKFWAGLSVMAALVGAPASFAQTPDVAAIYKDSAGRPFADLGAERAPVPGQVAFASGSARLTAQALAVIEQQANWMLRNPATRVRVEGYADLRGSRAWNMRLGKRRAQAVRDALVRAGAPPSRIEVVSFGEDRPWDLGASPAALQRNRIARTVLLPACPEAPGRTTRECPR